jgi:hypothetical protein
VHKGAENQRKEQSERSAVFGAGVNVPVSDNRPSR